MSYTTSSLLAFMETELGPLLASLGLDVSDALLEGVNEIAALLGTAIADVDDDLKLRTLARWQAWQAALNAAANQYDLASSGDSLKRSQLWDHLMRRLAAAEAAASRYDEVAVVLASASTAYVTSSSGSGSPYLWPAYPEFD